MKHIISQVDGNIDLDEENSRTITGGHTHIQNSVKEKKNIKDIKDELIDSKVWENIKLPRLMLYEDLDNFSVEVTCEHHDYPDDFIVSLLAVSLLMNHSWPPLFSVISSQPPSYHTE